MTYQALVVKALDTTVDEEEVGMMVLGMMADAEVGRKEVGS